MRYSGPIECPNCHCPVDSRTRVCPYCRDSTQSAPWRWENRVGSHALSWTVGLLATCAVGAAAAWSSDWFFGTHLVEQIEVVVTDRFTPVR